RLDGVGSNCGLREGEFSIDQAIDLNGRNLRINQPELLDCMPGKQLFLAAAIVRGGARRQNLDCQIRRDASDLVRTQQVLPRASEQQQIRLHDIVLVQHDVERRIDDKASIVSRVLLQSEM